MERYFQYLSARSLTARSVAGCGSWRLIRILRMAGWEALALVDELHRAKSIDLYGILRDGLGPRDGLAGPRLSVHHE